MYTQITLIPHGANSVYFVMRNGTFCPYIITHFSLNLEQLYSAFIDNLLGKGILGSDPLEPVLFPVVGIFKES